MAGFRILQHLNNSITLPPLRSPYHWFHQYMSGRGVLIENYDSKKY